MESSEKDNNFKIKSSRDFNEQNDIMNKLSGVPKSNTPHTSKYSEKKSKFNEDHALELIDQEFKDLEDWLKREAKRLKSDCADICETIKIK